MTMYPMDTLERRDAILEGWWRDFADVPMDPETECIEEQFLCFSAGTKREDIWHWFDERHSKGVGYLLYGDGIDRTPELGKLAFRKMLCEDCEGSDCCYNDLGVCGFPLISGRKPNIDDDGCHDFVFLEVD